MSFCFNLKNNTIMPYFIKGLRYNNKYTTVIKTFIKQLANFVSN